MDGTGNSNFGYFAGGADSRVDRIDYSNDTQIASVRGSLSAPKSYVAASSSQEFGGAPNTSTDPLPAYIRDATTFDDRNTLDLPFKRVLGSFGYIGGGNVGPANQSRIDRIDYSNDTATASVRGPLSLARRQLAASGNSNFGYYGGGQVGTNTRVSTVDRIDFSNDLATASVRGPLRFVMNGLAASGNSNFGYYGGGTSGSVSTIDRIDYSNDTQTASVRGPISTSKGALSATGNSNFGYFSGGYPGAVSTVHRISYSNDTQIASLRGSLSIDRWRHVSTGNANFGYIGGGQTGSGNPGITISTVDRINYSNDITTASVRGPLSSPRASIAATGNSNFGYFGGGYGSIVDRINYSNDTAVASVRGPLSTASRTFPAATTNARSS